MVGFDEEAKAKLDAFCYKIDQHEVTRMRFPPFYPSIGDYPSFGDPCSSSGRFWCDFPGLSEAVPVNHYILDHLTRTTQVAQIPVVSVSVDEMDEDVATRFSAYLANPASGVEQIFVDLTRLGVQTDAVFALINQGILQSTTIQKVTFRWVTIAETFLTALCNNTSLRELHLDGVVIRQARRKRLVVAQPSVTTPKELTLKVKSHQSKEESAYIAHLVDRFASSRRLHKVMLSWCNDGLLSCVFKSLAKVHTVVIESCFITMNQLIELAIGLEKYGGTKSLEFSKCSFSRQAEYVLHKVLESAQGLDSVEIGALEYHTTHGCLRGPWQNGSVRSLSFAESSIQGKTLSGLQFFGGASCRLVSLWLHAFWTFHGPKTLSVLCRNLQRNQSLRSLQITTLRDFDPVADFIRENSILRELTVQECDWSQPSFISLLEAITVNSTLQKLCFMKCWYVNSCTVPWETILPQMKSVYQLHLDIGWMPGGLFEKIVSGIEGNHSLLKFSAEWRSDRHKEFQEKADKYTARNLRSHATLVLAGPSGAKCLPRIVSSLSSFSTSQFLVLEVLAQHCDMFCEKDTQGNTPTLD